MRFPPLRACAALLLRRWPTSASYSPAAAVDHLRLAHPSHTPLPSPHHITWRGKKGRFKEAHHERPAAAAVAEAFDPTALHHTAEQTMRNALDSLTKELSTLRSGRAHPGLLDAITVQVPGGARVPLRQVAQVALKDARTLLVSVHDPAAVSACENAIRNAGLGLNPVQTGGKADPHLLVPLLAPSRDAKQKMARTAALWAEEARKRVRQARREALDVVKRECASEDERHAHTKQIESLTEDWIARVDRALHNKRAELGE